MTKVRIIAELIEDPENNRLLIVIDDQEVQTFPRLEQNTKKIVAEALASIAIFASGCRFMAVVKLGLLTEKDIEIEVRLVTDKGSFIRIGKF